MTFDRTAHGGAKLAKSPVVPGRINGPRRFWLALLATVDVLIATRCLAHGLRRLHSDDDFDAFEKNLGLCVVNCEA